MYCSVASISSFGEEVTKDFGKIDGENTTNDSNGRLGLQNMVRRKFTNDISKGPGLKNFMINSSVQPVKCENVPYIRNVALNGLNRKGKVKKR